MSVFLNNVVQSADDFIWDKIVENLPRNRKSNTGFLNFNCPMCGDYKPRCGVRRGAYIGINCYNCGFTTRYSAGSPLNKKMRDFLERIGLSHQDIGRIKHQALVVSRALESVETLPESVASYNFSPSFDAVALPDGSAPLSWWAEQDCLDPDFLAVAKYALSRGNHIVERANFHWSPAEKFSQRLIMPFTFHDKIVGFTARAVNDDGDKYLNTMPANYLFNNEVLDQDGDYVFIVEGPTDALSINGVSPLGAKMNQNQVRWINSAGKLPVVIADRDEAGIKLLEIAQANNGRSPSPAWVGTIAIGGMKTSRIVMKQ